MSLASRQHIVPKQAYLEEWVKLKGQLAKVDRDCRTAESKISIVLTEPGHYNDLVNHKITALDVSNTNSKGENEMKEAFKTNGFAPVQSVKSQIKAFRRASRQENITGYSKLLSIKEMMECIEEDIGQAKLNNSSQMQSLEEEQRKLELELAHAVDRIHTRADEGSALVFTATGFQQPHAELLQSSVETITINSATNEQRLYPRDEMHARIREFDSFIQRNGGALGGWDADEHTAFMKIFKKAYNNQKNQAKLALFAQKVVNLFPGMDVPALLEHIAWTQQYEKLLFRKREAIAHWKLLKSAHQKMKSKDLTAEQLEGISDLKSSIRTQADQKRRAEIKIRLEAWKLEKKASENENAIHGEYDAEKLERHRKEIAFLKHQVRLKEKLRQYEEQRSTEAIKLSSISQRPNSATSTKINNKLTEKDFARIRERNEAMLSKKGDRQADRVAADAKRRMRIEKLAKSVSQSIHIPEDQTRLYNPTQAFLMKRRDQPASSIPLKQTGLYLQQIPTRSIPSWRMGL